METTQEPKLSAIDLIRNYLPGQLSWGQKVRDLRQEMWELGGNLSCERMSRGIFRYKIEMPK